MKLQPRHTSAASYRVHRTFACYSLLAGRGNLYVRRAPANRATCCQYLPHKECAKLINDIKLYIVGQ